MVTEGTVGASEEHQGSSRPEVVNIPTDDLTIFQQSASKLTRWLMVKFDLPAMYLINKQEMLQP